MRDSNPIKARPFIKFVGGKGGLLDQFLPLVPEKFDRYYEPFVGGGAVFFALQPDRAHLSDANSELITCYGAIRDNVEKVIKHLEAIPVNEETFLKVREDQVLYNPPLLAARMIYLNKVCFNGLYRVNKAGKFNVSWGKKDPKAFPAAYDFDNIRACSKVLQGVGLLVGDFSRTLGYIGKGDFVYLDPPYAPVSKTSNFTSYTSDKFGVEDQKRLARLVDDLSARKVQVMLSSSDTPAMLKLFKGYRITTIQAARNINCVGTKRGKVNEIVVRNYGGKK